MERLKPLFYVYTVLVILKFVACQDEDVFTARGNISKYRFSFQKNFDKVGISDEFSSFAPSFNSFKVSESAINTAKKNMSSNSPKRPTKRFDDNLERMVYKPSTKLDSFWMTTPHENFTARKDSIKKLDHSVTWPTWSSKREIYHNNRNKKNRKYLDSIEDYLGLDSKYHEMADRKYIHEHEGFFFPIHVPSSHHEKDDHLIPLLLLLLLPLLLFAIIIPLNANLLSTLFLIMQNNGATTTAAQLAAAGRRRRRHLFQASHPIVEQRIMELLHKISAMDDYDFLF